MMCLWFLWESGRGEGPCFNCNICDSKAEFVVQLELVKGSRKYTRQMPFYLYKSREYVYKKMQSSIELKDYFTETIKENQ
jgi:5-bromo-4-chloroindolyl phosphate hydrolysis protein